MSRLQLKYLLLFVIVILLLTSGLSASSTVGPSESHSVTIDRIASIDVVKSDGLLIVSPTYTNYNSTTNTADIKIEITNQASSTFEEVHVNVDGNSEYIYSIGLGKSDSVLFPDVSCTSTITIQATADSITIKQSMPTECL